jgi:hypothetical protein
MRLRFTAAIPTFEDISTLVDRYLSKGQIYNVDYQQLNRDITRATGREANQWHSTVLPQKNWKDLNDEERELVEYAPSDFGTGAFELLRDARKARKLVKSRLNMDLIFPFYRRWEPLCEKFLSLKPLIVKGRQISEIPSNLPPRTLENTGTCAVCQRNVKLRGTKIMDHGYTKGYGWRNGICFGAGYQAIELSPEGLEAYRDYCEKRIKELPAEIQGRTNQIEDARAALKLNPSDEEAKKDLALFKQFRAQLTAVAAALPTVLAETLQRLKTWKAKPLPKNF